MHKIRIMLDFMGGPIWPTHPGTIKPETGIEAIDNDAQLIELNRKIHERYCSYYEFDSHEQACWFNEEQEKADKELMLDWLARLKKRINEIGEFEIEDKETPYYISL